MAAYLKVHPFLIWFLRIQRVFSHLVIRSVHACVTTKHGKLSNSGFCSRKIYVYEMNSICVTMHVACLDWLKLMRIRRLLLATSNYQTQLAVVVKKRGKTKFALKSKGKYTACMSSSYWLSNTWCQHFSWNDTKKLFKITFVCSMDDAALSESREEFKSLFLEVLFYLC